MSEQETEERQDLRTCCKVGLDVYPAECPEHGGQVPADILDVDDERPS